MHAEFGHYLLYLALFLSIALGVFPMVGSFTRQTVFLSTAKPLTLLLFFALLASFICLAYAFLIDDFSIKYVAHHSNSLMPERFKISAIWGAHEGSLLLWILILSGWMFAVAMLGTNLPPLSYARVLSVLGMIATGFVSFMLFTSNPFERTLPFFPIDGADLNPLLQDFGLIIHPPLLYMGYVGFAVSFAFAISALIEGEWTATWARWTRPWTIAAWSCLTLGVMLGSWWAYYELGWGGWWMWDPSENASLLPWLSGTALMHSLAVTDKRDSFKGWTLALSLVTFSLSLLGTFLIRSGVLTSVHAFTNDPERGRFILIFLAIVVFSALMLFLFRAKRVKTKADFSETSKDMILLFNNILFIALTFIVLFGTLYPMIAEAFGRKLSVGAPYFDSLFPYPVIMLAILVGIGPLLNWKHHDISKLTNVFVKVAVVSIVVSLVAVWLTGTFYAWVFTGIFVALWIGMLTFYDISNVTRRGTNLIAKAKKIKAAYLGMVIAHLGVAVMIVGVVVVSDYSIEKDLRMSVGESKTFGDYRFEMQNSEDSSKENYQATMVTFKVFKEDEMILTMKPEKRYYLAGKQLMTEAAIDATLFRDLYVSLGESLDASGTTWSVRIYIKPFIRWIWLGAILMGFGGFISIMDKRYKNLKEKTKND